MRSSGKRAVVAAALPGEAEVLAAMLRDIGFSETVRASDGLNALRLVREAPTDALVADAVLPVLDGVSLARRIRASGLPVYPATVLLTVPGMCPGRGEIVLDKPVRPEELAALLESLVPEKRRIPEEKLRLAEKTLDAIGVAEHCGREYLLRAIGIVWADVRYAKSLTTRLYPAVGAMYGADGRHVERAMRHVIDAAWRNGEIEAQYRIFGDTIDARRGSPTCGEMIAKVADILRWEGKA